MTLNFMDANGGGTIGSAVEILDYAIGMGARVVSFFLGGVYPRMATIEAAVLRAKGREILLVASAGNEGADVATKPVFSAPLSLSYFNTVISIDVTDQTGKIVSFPSYRSSVSIAAPGDQTAFLWKDNQYYSSLGASMTCPQVSGLAALLLGTARENFNKKYVGISANSLGVFASM